MVDREGILGSSNLDMTGAMAVLNTGSWATFVKPVTSHTRGSNSFEYVDDFADNSAYHFKAGNNRYYLDSKRNLLDNPGEWLITADADLSLLAELNVSDGGLTSAGGIISLLGGGKLSDPGKLDLSGSTWVLNGNFVKSSGNLISSHKNCCGNAPFKIRLLLR